MANRGCSVLMSINSHTLGEQVSTFIMSKKYGDQSTGIPWELPGERELPGPCTTQMVPPAGCNNRFDSVPEGVESAQPEQSQESQENSLLLNINSSTQLKCHCILFRQERPEKLLL